jgi:L-histidine Nalpha-methyltransferase
VEHLETLPDPAAAAARFIAAAEPRPYFYDLAGSRIYEEITALPEYYPTRTEAGILAGCAGALRRRLGPARLVELGSGSSQKTRLLLDAWGAADEPTLYAPIDVSAGMLQASAEALVADYPALRVLALAGRYEDGLAALPPSPRALYTFLGGTIGNFAPDAQDAFARLIAARMSPGAHLLLGFDRRPNAKKSARRIFEAYNDAAGVTARFNLNLLVRLNRELGADFRVDRFAHVAPYNEELDRIEMYLESLEDQEVFVPALGRAYRFARGERILTEISRKHDAEELAAWFEARGFSCEEGFGDRGGLFGVLLLRRA